MNAQQVLRTVSSLGQKPISLLIAAIIIICAPVFMAGTPFVPAHTYMLAPESVRLIPNGRDIAIRLPAADEPVFDLKSAHRLGPDKLHQYTHRFVRGEHTERDASVLLTAAPGETRIYMNGISLDTVQSQNMAAPGLETYAVTANIPAHYFHPGPNTLGVALSPSDSYSRPGNMYMGPKHMLSAVVTRLEQQRQVLPQLFSGLGAFLMITSALGLLFSKFRKPYIWSLLIGGLILTSGQVETSEVFWLTGSQAALLLCALGAALYCMLCLSRVGTARRVQWIVFTVLALGAGASFWAFQTDRLDRLLPWVLMVTLLPTSAYSISRLWRFYRHIRPTKKAEGLLFALAGLSLVPALLYSVPFLSPARLDPSAPRMTAFLYLLFPLCLCLVSASRLTEFLKNHQTRQKRLHMQLAETGRQLTEKEVALQVETKRRTKLEERQRLSRDMHDGIGGHLLSLLMRVRSGGMDMGQVESEIEDGINDLRLIVDSMDQTGDDLMQVLAVFRARARDQLEAVGIKLEWTQSDPIYQKVTGTRMTLDLYRFLQEAVSNAVRHARAKHLQISLLQRASDEPLIISVADDGIGLPETSRKKSAGKGLKNMRTRARALGGQMVISTGIGNKGTGITLEIPPA